LWSVVGAVIVVGVLALLLAPTKSPGANASKTVDISASNTEWTRVAKIKKGGTAHVKVLGGDATCHVGGASDCPIGNPRGSGQLCSAAGPNGDQNYRPGPAGPDIPYGGLAGRLTPPKGKPHTFAFGAAKQVHGPGVLELVFNDCLPPDGYGDNAGSFQV